jgi:hypothetical protein
MAFKMSFDSSFLEEKTLLQHATSASSQPWSGHGRDHTFEPDYPTYHTAVVAPIIHVVLAPRVHLLYHAEGGSTALRRCDNPDPRASRDFRTPDVIYMHTWSWLPLLIRSAKRTRPQPRKGPKTALVALLCLQALARRHHLSTGGPAYVSTPRGYVVLSLPRAGWLVVWRN